MMRKLNKHILLIILALSLSNIIYSQVYNNGHLLSPKTFRFVAAPSVYYSSGVQELFLFLNGGVKLADNVDLGASTGINDGANYYGGYLEFAIANNFSLTGGAHHYNSFGLDAAINASIPIGSAFINIGLDNDLYFPDKNTIKYDLYLPVGFEAPVNNTVIVYFETDIGLNIKRIIFNGGIALKF